jgi:hypothetical protein
VEGREKMLHIYIEIGDQDSVLKKLIFRESFSGKMQIYFVGKDFR